MASDTRAHQSAGLSQWLVPALFVLFLGWLIWHTPAFILDLAPPDTDSAVDRLAGQHLRNDVTPGLPGLFGGAADVLDWLAFIGVPILFVLGLRQVTPSHMEEGDWNLMDRLSIFLGRVTMAITVFLLLVMAYEVVLRYIFEAPTLWANELSLWLAGFLFLFAGLYAMQQRSHITIFIVYDLFPRWLQRLCDSFSVFLIFLFSAGLIWGGYKEASEKFYRWETLGTAFDPPLPATILPAILIVSALVSVQALSNLIRDWNKAPQVHTDEPDADEIETLKRAVGGD